MLGAGNRKFWIPKVVKSEAKITPKGGLKRRKSEPENEQFPESAKIGEMGAVSAIDNRSSIGSRSTFDFETISPKYNAARILNLC